MRSMIALIRKVAPSHGHGLLRTYLSGNIFGSGHRVCAHEIAPLVISYSACICAMCLDKIHTKYEIRSLLEHSLAYRKRAVQLFNSLKESRKRSNLQEGAMNARAWASQLLATVSNGDASTGRVVPVSEFH
ncbi:hypothetical protein FNV43_RR04368 [Rhamnella rubrinervis]|uniref:Uncharacterized protein n=1 Tax=Rhamnella rubrinervis TaxID=2594499 RepID=A0A8K0HJM3_9ROSA|nr:hypothetical protein FNV43_RR04368 [Rhamnella rubrinervis]